MPIILPDALSRSSIVCRRSTLRHNLQQKRNRREYLNPPPKNAFGDQKPFREKVSGLPKAFV
jgi:hypothetical protein